MAQILKSKSIYYNDVNLVAQPCKVKSRKDIPVELNRVIVSPMEAIVGKTFALKILCKYIKLYHINRSRHSLENGKNIKLKKAKNVCLSVNY